MKMPMNPPMMPGAMMSPKGPPMAGKKMAKAKKGKKKGK
jgi:hypothetical protein